MILEEYLKTIIACPDRFVYVDKKKTHILTAEYGIYDNYSLLLDADYDDMISFLKKFFEFDRKRDHPCLSWFARHIGSDLTIQVYRGEVAGEGTKKHQSMRDYQKQRRYNLSIVLHPGEEREIGENLRAAAGIVELIGNYAIKTITPLCLPKSMGWAHASDYSRIIYFP